VDAESRTEFETVPGALLGTPHYMSPQQAKGEDLTPATDIFSLGIVFYEMLTGEHPFKGEGPLALLHAIITHPVTPPSKLRPAIPLRLSDLILSMLDKRPDARPSASAVDAALAELEGDRISSSDTAGPAAAKPQRERIALGRDREIAELQAALESTRSAGGRILCVPGETGLGKTALVEDFLAGLEASGQAVIVRGRCSERLAGTEAYLPLLEGLESLLHRDPATGRLLIAMAPSWHAQLGPVSGAPVAPAQANTQERLKRELASFFLELSRQRPTVLFFDDLHWADVSTVDVLSYLAGKFDSLRLLVVLAYRPSELRLAKHPFLNIQPDLQAHGLCHELSLHPLAAPDFALCVAREFPGHRFSQSFLSSIYSRTGGNPLFMVDLLRYLRDHGVVAQRDGGWDLLKPVDEVERDVPESLRGLIQRKIDRLSEEDRRLLTAASVQGAEFDSAVLVRVLALDPAEVEERLESLERVHALVRVEAEHEFPDRTPTMRYRFVQTLYQNVLYSALRPTRRSSLSAAVAQTLAAAYGERKGEIASQLARLYETARDFANAAEQYGVAAQNAVHIFASQEAVLLARRGLAALEALPAGPERSAREMELRLQLGISLTVVKGYGNPETGACFARAQELGAALGEPRHLFPVMLGVWFYYLVSGECGKGLELAERLARIAETRSDAMPGVAANYALGQTLEIVGDLQRARKHTEASIAFYQPADHLRYRALYGFDPGMYAISDAARILWLLGYPDQARQKIALALAHYKQVDPRSQSMALTLACILHQFCHEPAAALETANECVEICDRFDVPQEREWSNFMRGWAIGALGDPDAGIGHMRASLQALGELHSTVIIGTHYAALLAETLAQAGRDAEGLEVIDGALKFVARTGDRHYEPEIYRIRGQLLLGRGDPAAAEQSFRMAIDIARLQHARSWELRAATSLSRLLLTRRATIEVRETLAPVYYWFTEGLDTGDLRQAREVLEELSRQEG
jgi:adenylate cyclase